jgi:AraC family cel operon transcriptional repressor
VDYLWAKRMSYAKNIPCLSLDVSEIESGISYLKQFSVYDTYPLHSHNFYEFFYIVKGKAIHNINGENQLLLKGSFIFIRPSDVHKYSYFNNYDMHIITCAMPAEAFLSACEYLQINHEVFTKPALPPHIILEGSDFWDLENKLGGIVDKKDPDIKRQYFRSIFPELLYLFVDTKRHNTTLLPVWLSELVARMEQPENFIGGLSVMKSFANVSQEHLNRIFKIYLHTTPTRYINAKRINYASRLMLEQEHEIIDICYSSGFNSLSYFYKIFKDYYKCTPKQFLNAYMRGERYRTEATI